MTALRAGDFPNAIRLLREAVAAANKADYRLGLAEALEKSGCDVRCPRRIRDQRPGLDAVNVRYTAEWAKALNRAGRNTEADSRSTRRRYRSRAEQSGEPARTREPPHPANDFARARPHLESGSSRSSPTTSAPKQNLARALEAARDLDGAGQTVPRHSRRDARRGS